MRILVLSRGENSSDDGGWDQIRAYRELKYDRMLRKLAVLQKNAALRSGSRGSQARKELLTFEKNVEEAKEGYTSTNTTIDYLGALTKGKVSIARNLHWTQNSVRTN